MKKIIRLLELTVCAKTKQIRDDLQNCKNRIPGLWRLVILKGRDISNFLLFDWFNVIIIGVLFVGKMHKNQYTIYCAIKK